MHPTVKSARIAGLLYLLMALPGPFILMYLPNLLIVTGNATATANNLLHHEMLFRTGIVANLFSSVLFILLALALYRLFSGVNKTQAALLVTLVAVSATIALLNEVNDVAALTLARGADFLAAIDKPQREAFAMLFLRLHSQGNTINEFLWGLWLFPFGVLVMRSGFLPRLLGVLLIVNCFAYVALSLTGLLFPDFSNLAFQASTPALMGEIWIMLWLLIKGVKVPRALADAAPQVVAAA
jgi:hypothetical protein